MLRHLVVSIVGACAILLCASAQADDGALRVGMSGGYLPFTFVEQDTLEGFDADVMEAVAEEMGIDVEFVTASFLGAVRHAGVRAHRLHRQADHHHRGALAEVPVHPAPVPRRW